MSTAGEVHVVFGSGPVGLAVVETLMAQGKQIRVVSRSGSRRSVPETVELVRGDATHPEDARQVCLGASHVYHCANAPTTTAGQSSSRRFSAASWLERPRPAPSSS